MSINFVVNCHFTKIALLGLTHFLGTVSRLCTKDEMQGIEDEGKVHVGHQGHNGAKGAYSRT